MMSRLIHDVMEMDVSSNYLSGQKGETRNDPEQDRRYGAGRSDNLV
jgi:hypothetical protein